MLLLRALLELIRYEVIKSLGGFQRIHSNVRKTTVSKTAQDSGTVARVCDAVTLASCFYWKPVLCLQRAVATTRLLRQHGVPAEMVIGYRPSPFFSHSWVEVNGSIVNDSPAFQERLFVLDRL